MMMRVRRVSILIRPAQETDISMLELLYTERQTIVAQADPRLRPLVDKPIWVERPHGMVWVGGQPVGGYISLWFGAWPKGELPFQTALIDHMTLDAHAYYPGLARALLDTAQVWAKQNGATRLLALVPRYDPVGQAFWRSLHTSPAPDPTDVKVSGYQVFQVPL